MSKIAIIGASDSVEKIYNILSKKYLDIEFILRKEDKIENTTKYILEEEKNVDGIFLTGIAIYHTLLKKSTTTFSKPIIYSKRGAMSIVKTLWEVLKNKERIDLKIGFDIVEEEKFLEICKEFDVKIEYFYHQEYIFGKDEKRYLEKYIELYKKKKINCILTSFGYIYKELKKMNIPVFRIQATNIDIEDEFRTLLHRIKLKKAEKNKMSVLLLKIDNYYKIMNEQMLAERKEIEKILLEYSREVQGLSQSVSSNEYLVISNKELIIDKTNLRELHKMINEIETLEINIGIGEGDTIFNAEINARKALKLSEKESSNSIFLYSEKEIIGPLMENRESKYEISEKIKKISEETGINLNILQKLSLLQKKQKENYFKSLELVEYLNISERSINRILKPLLEKGYLKEKKEKQIVGAGRPRRKFKFEF